jgi:hypothetical protein
MKEKINLKSILYWIMDNQDDTEAMDKINKSTFVFTSKYTDWKKTNLKDEDTEDKIF